MVSIRDWPSQCVEATPSMNRNEHTSTICAPIGAGVGTCHDNRGAYHTPASLPSSTAHPFTFPDPVPPQAVGPIRTVRPNHRANHRYEGSVFDRPGKKAAAGYEPDPAELRTRCRQRGGKDFAVTWMSKIFVNGVAVDALSWSSRPIAKAFKPPFEDVLS